MRPDYYEHGIRTNWFQRYWHRRRCDVLKELIGDTNTTLVDVGCNGGFLTSKIAERANRADIVSLDVDRSSVLHAREAYSLATLVADGCNLPFKTESVDVITCLEVLEHVPDPRQMVAEGCRCLKKGGRLIVLVPNSTLLFRIIWFFWTKTWGRTWQDKHVSEFNKDSLRQMLLDSGLEITNLTTFHAGMLTAIKAVKA